MGSLKGRFLRFLFRNVYKTPWEGAQTAVHVALDKRAGEVSGELFKNCKLIGHKRGEHSGKVSKQLREESVRLVKMSGEEFDRCFTVL
ncbi:unnamed protein product, partial [Iphiclides podalirius]